MFDSLSQPLFWPYAFYIALVIVTVLHMLYQRRSPQNLMAWLLTLLLLPFIGVLLYIILGSRKFLSQRKRAPITMRAISATLSENELCGQLDRLLQSNHIASTTPDNQITLHEESCDVFEQFMTEINQAKTSIHLQTYIFQLDETGKTILNALITKAQQGVEVRLLMDAIGSFSLYLNRKSLAPLIEAGGQYAFFQPLFKSLVNSQINLRNHRKIYLFDQSTLLTGGMNLSNEYLGSPKNTPKEGRWKDLMLKAKGPVSFHYQNVFNADWFYTTKEKLSPPLMPQLNLTETQGIIQTIPSGPDIRTDSLFESLLYSIHTAKKSIQIVTPYFIPDSTIMNALLMAIKRGVSVSLITPKNSDHLLFDIGRSSYIRELTEEGGEVFFDQGTMLHAKLILIDRVQLILGSANLDYRSLFINHEIVNVIYSKALINQMSYWLNNLQKHSLIFQPTDKKLHRLFENLTRIFTPIL